MFKEMVPRKNIITDIKFKSHMTRKSRCRKTSYQVKNIVSTCKIITLVASPLTRAMSYL